MPSQSVGFFCFGNSEGGRTRIEGSRSVRFAKRTDRFFRISGSVKDPKLKVETKEGNDEKMTRREQKRTKEEGDRRMWNGVKKSRKE